MSLPYSEGDLLRCYWSRQPVFGVHDPLQYAYQLPWTKILPSFTPNLLAAKCLGGHYSTTLRRGMHRGDLSLAWNAPDAAHALLADIDTFASFSFEVFYGIGSFASPANLLSLLYTGCRVNKWTFEGQAAPKDDESAFLRHNIEVVAQELSVDTVKKSNDNRYLDNYLNADKTWQDIVITKAGAEIQEVTRFKVDFDYGLTPIPVIRSADAHLMKYLKATRKNCTVELDFEFENSNQLTDVLADTARTWTIGLGYTAKEITFANCKLSVVSLSSPKNDIVYLKARLYPQSVAIDA